MMDLPRKLAGESLGTALLLAVVIGSGVMGERLAGGNAAIALLANTLATVGGLYVLIEAIHNVFEPRLHPSGHPNEIEASGEPRGGTSAAGTEPR